MKRKVLIFLISAMLLGCLSIPVFAQKQEDFIFPSFKTSWGKGYEQLRFDQPGRQVITYYIYSRDKNNKQLDVDANSKVGPSNTATFKTAKNSKAKSGYYRYVTYVVGTSSVVWKKQGPSTK